MPLNVSTGNMYPFVTATWNTIKGKCPHSCIYCYMKRFGEQKPVRFDNKELKIDLGMANFIFIGSSCDMFAEDIPLEWIIDTLDYCKKFENRYLFQTKNPERLYKLRQYLPPDSVVGTTIETNRTYPEMGNTPLPQNRAKYMALLSITHQTMVTLEPLMDFDLDYLEHLISHCEPQWINIGADSQRHNLQEPSEQKILELINRLEKFTEVKLKQNLKRLLLLEDYWK